MSHYGGTRAAAAKRASYAAPSSSPYTYATTQTATRTAPTPPSSYSYARQTMQGVGQESSVLPPPPSSPSWGVIAGWGTLLLAATGLFYAATEGLGTGRVATNRKRGRRSSRLRANGRRRSRRRSSRGRRARAQRRMLTRRNPQTIWRVYGSPGARRHWGGTYRTEAEAEREARRLRAQGLAGAHVRSTKLQYSGRRSSRRNPKLVNNIHRFKALSAAARKRMSPSSFALPGKRFPIEGPPGSSRERDKWQALQAIRYLHMGRVGTKSEYLAIRNAIIGRYGMKFWRDYDGPSWAKVERAKRRRRTTRRGRGRGRRRMAANSRRRPRSKLPAWMNKLIYWGRDGNSYYVQAPNHKVRLYRGRGAKERARTVARKLSDRYGLSMRKADNRLSEKYPIK